MARNSVLPRITLTDNSETHTTSQTDLESGSLELQPVLNGTQLGSVVSTSGCVPTGDAPSPELGSLLHGGRGPGGSRGPGGARRAGGARGMKTSRWSITYLTKQFCSARIEDLYQRYRLRLQRRLLLRLLVAFTCYQLVLLVLQNTVGHDEQDDSHLLINICTVLTAVFPLLLAVPVFVARVYYRRHAALVISLVVWLYVNALLFVYLLVTRRHGGPGLLGGSGGGLGGLGGALGGAGGAVGDLNGAMRVPGVDDVDELPRMRNESLKGWGLAGGGSALMNADLVTIDAFLDVVNQNLNNVAVSFERTSQNWTNARLASITASQDPSETNQGLGGSGRFTFGAAEEASKGAPEGDEGAAGHHHQQVVSPSVNVPLVFYCMFAIHTMLPLSRKASTALAAITALLDLALTGALTAVKDRVFVQEICANCVIYFCSTLTGLFHKHLTDIANRHTFLETRRFIEADMTYASQKKMQSEVKEGLLLKIIPKHHLADMKKMLTRKLAESVDTGSAPRPSFVIGSVRRHSLDARSGSRQRIPSGSVPRQNFHELLVERHDNVSILYADIVNFTPLTSSLEPSELVLTLNQLFGGFDELAKANSCLRIKMLGDCYYCVCGLPDPLPSHARSCIIMGIQMIKVIRAIRQEAGVENLDMRIGVHTGYVLSGVLGLKKWQYDIWSDDVTVANHMEASGLPGKIHLSDVTLLELGGEFEVEEAYGAERDEVLKQSNIRTYFLSENEYQKVPIDDVIRRDDVTLDIGEERGRSGELSLPSHVTRRRFSTYMQAMGAELPFDKLREYQQSLATPDAEEVNRRLERAFYLEKTSRKDYSGKERLDVHTKALHLLTLRFKDEQLERDYVNSRDAYFKFYLAWALVVYIFLILAQLILLDRPVNLCLALVAGVVFFAVLLLLAAGLRCRPFHSCRLSLKHNALLAGLQARLNVVSEKLISNKTSKICLCFLSVSTIFAASAVPVINCHTDQWVKQHPELPGVNGSFISATDPLPCLFAPYYTYCCMITLIACSVFLRVTHIAKTAFMLVCLAVFNIMFYHVFSDVFAFYDHYFNIHHLSSTVRASMHTALLFTSLLILDRQVEKNLRQDFLCSHEAQAAKRELERNELINELLLVNILPRHVADHFLHATPTHRTELYHIICPNASIMFAAIPNFKTFFSEVDVTGKECLRLLNEIISHFDKMTMMTQFKNVEKLKTIGSTYMAAAGLAPDGNEKQEQSSNESLLLIVQFAFAMIHNLADLSRDAFFEYKLRIGINQGKVIAGVVGASKPQFDIWGDAVNVASRMESHGVLGRIQVTEDTAEVLRTHGLACDYRARIVVKGKGEMGVCLVSASCIPSIPSACFTRIPSHNNII